MTPELRWKTWLTTSLMLVVCSLALQGQNDNRWVIAFERPNSAQEKVLKSNPHVKKAKCIFKDLDLWVIETTAVDEKIIRKFLDNLSNVRYYHKDYISTSRFNPNDPDFPSQWALDKIGMNLAWDITTGGKTPTGDDIVVAIFDDGFQLDHPDYAANIWRNEAEIPDNGIDDDGNGYVDDFNGWNSTSETDNHETRRHGTSVAGIIGAIGDNQNQMTGMMWDVKLMLTSGGSQAGVSASDVVAAYEYIYEQRLLYNQSNGAEGAYVVVSNYSGGIGGQTANDLPEWCEVLELLGSAGVLNVGSSPNSDTDIDIQGDIPGSCPTDFLIVVTNTDRLDQKVMNAGFGAIGVDIGAPGDDILTTTTGSDIDPAFFGTSAAAPHVAGTVALMYSLICPEAFQSSLTEPGSMALAMKSAIMNSVVNVPNLRDITVSGGRLNTLRAIETINESTIGDCCAVFLDSIIVSNESCLGAEDAELELSASGRDIRGDLIYNVILDNIIFSDRLGTFNRLASGTYEIEIVDDMDMNCRLDTTLTLAGSIEECPFGNFEISEIRQSSNSITLGYSIDEQKDIQIQVHNSLGQLIYNRLETPSLDGLRTHTVNTVSWPSGVYHASILATGFRDVKSFFVIEGL